MTSDDSETAAPTALRAAPERTLAPARSTLGRAPQRTAPTRRRPSRRKFVALAALLALGAAGGFVAWRLARPAAPPPGFASGAGRLEQDEIHIDAKFAGHVAETLVGEGEAVTAGQLVARMDTRDFEASLRVAEAQAAEARKSVDEARSGVAQRRTELTLARQEYDRTSALVAQGFATQELLDQRRQALAADQAALKGAEDLVGVAERALDAATHDVELDKVNIAEGALVAPRDGRILYRVASVGEALPAGGCVYAMLDPSYVYMDIYLPTPTAGKAPIGAEARVALDARPNAPMPAKVVFVAAQAQFTPKIVETPEDREAFMFRIRVRVDPDWLARSGPPPGGGARGVATVKLDPAASWPPALRD